LQLLYEDISRTLDWPGIFTKAIALRLNPDIKIKTRRIHRKLGGSSKQAYCTTAPLLEKML
jgi:hypothetical protein